MKKCFSKGLILLLFIYFIPVSCQSIHSSSENLVQGLNIKTKQFTALDFNGSEDELFFGISVVGLGDVNNDGYNDIMVGESGEETALSLLTIPVITLVGDEDSDRFGANL